MANENASYKTKKDSILCVFRLANTVCFSFSSIPFLGIGKKKKHHEPYKSNSKQRRSESFPLRRIKRKKKKRMKDGDT